MASHVVVIDSSARRVTVKTTPNKYLSDILDEACGKLGLTSSQYGLKNNRKQIDLSRTIRLSGLTSGAKLELVQLSKSAGVVSVALQLPESEARDVPNGRLTDKFPSTTTLWLILRKFEAGVAGSAGARRNLTARGAPSTNQGSSGAGRLYYQTPVIQVLGREFFSFTDLQKSLAQLGLNSGTALLRLTFRPSETPLEEAMEHIERYFKTAEGSAEADSVATVPQHSTGKTSSEPPDPEPSSSSKPAPEWTEDESAQPPPDSVAPSDTNNTPSSPITTSAGRPLSVYAPPTSSTPTAARTSSFNPSDYMPTVEHAQSHQRMLSQSSRNIRLPTEAELAQQAEAEQAKLAAVKEVEVKVRFPDETAVSTQFKQGDSGTDLYGFVRSCLDERWKAEPFELLVPGAGSTGVATGANLARTKSAGTPSSSTLPESSEKLLIRDLGLKGRVLLVFQWDGAAGADARASREILKKELRAQAQRVEVRDVGLAAVDGAGEGEERGVKVDLSASRGKEGAGEDGEGKRKMPKWLKGLSKK